MHESRQIWRKSRITHSVYPGDSRSICDLRFVNSQPLAVFARTIKGHELDFTDFFCDASISIHCSCILEDF